MCLHGITEYHSQLAETAIENNFNRTHFWVWLIKKVVYNRWLQQGGTLGADMLASQHPNVQQSYPGIEPEVLPVERAETPFRFVIRIVAERKADYWQAFTLELGLAAQAESLPEVKSKLESMIRSYLFDALEGEDIEHAYELLTRKATWKVYAKYHLCFLIWKVGYLLGRSKDHVIYNKLLPLEPRLS
jgi:hypothetical protein